LLAGDECVWPTEEDLRYKVPSQLAAQGALDGDRLKGKFLTPGRHIPAAPLALHDEGFAP
jgi:hypothetical protein